MPFVQAVALITCMLSPPADIPPVSLGTADIRCNDSIQRFVKLFLQHGKSIIVSSSGHADTPSATDTMISQY